MRRILSWLPNHFFLTLAFTGAFIALINGIPLGFNGLCNNGLNILLLMLNKRLCRNSRICLSFPVVYGSVWQVVGDQHPKIRRNVFDESKEVALPFLLPFLFSRRPLVQHVPGTLANHKWIFAIQAYCLI